MKEQAGKAYETGSKNLFDEDLFLFLKVIVFLLGKLAGEYAEVGKWHEYS